MKLLFLVDDYLPSSIKVAAVMMHDLALELIAQGHDVTVCTPDHTLKKPFSIEELDGVKVMRFKLGAIKNTSKVKRVLNEALLPYVAWDSLRLHFKSNRHDMIVYYSPTIFWGPLVKKLKLVWSCNSFLILRDFFPQWAVDYGMIKKHSLIHRYFKYFEGVSYEAANIIAVQSPSNKEYFEKNKDYKQFIDKLDVLYNWSNVNKVEKHKGTYRKQLGLTGKVVFFYGGNIGYAQDTMNIVRLAKSLQDYPEAHFLLVGKGDEVKLIKQSVIKDKINNVLYLPPVNQNEYQKMLSEFDVGLFSLHKNHKTHNFPGKLLGYMKQSIPILGSVNSGNDLCRVLNDAKSGFVTINGDDDGLLKSAVQLLESVELRKQMGINANNLLHEKFSVKSAAAKIVQYL